MSFQEDVARFCARCLSRALFAEFTVNLMKATQQLLGYSSPSTALEYYTAQDSIDTLAKFVEDGDVTRW